MTDEAELVDRAVLEEDSRKTLKILNAIFSQFEKQEYCACVCGENAKAYVINVNILGI